MFKWLYRIDEPVFIFRDMDEIETLGQKLGEITDLHSLKRYFN